MFQELDAKAELQNMQGQLEEIKDTDAHHITVVDYGDGWAQGDVLIQFVDTPTHMSQTPDLLVNVTFVDFAVEGNRVEPVVNDEGYVQLVDGDNVGSRHCVKPYDGLHIFAVDHPLVAALIDAPKGIEIVHPEHGNFSCETPGWYLIRHQRALGDSIERVLD